MKEILNYLFEHKTLDKTTARQVFINMAQGKYNNSQMAAFMTVFLMRSITVEELGGFRDAMLELCIPFDTKGIPAIDVCGTGGDGKNTFNISTLVAFVVAGAGVKVVKHGNYGVSSIAGSSNILEYFGYQFTNDQEKLLKMLETAGIAFLHAPMFHPALKNVAPIRRELGVKTFFNMLGPMVNPAFPAYQMVGVFSLELARKYGYLYQQTDKKFAIVHSIDGYDEISLTSPCKLINLQGEHILTAEDFGSSPKDPQELYGGDTVEEAAKIFMQVLEGKGTPTQNEVVIANAAIALQTVTPSVDLPDALERARCSLLGGKALQSFRKLISIQS
ncbi:MAG: anthranilate phosphoribosyltransferase [Cytophagales bacterium]|nr:anthranilate phosphoribosyltransferase [Bernardetiaceae bacterium]MDW8211638.1 anthranilate phosphoribosyltransferase [Cytophagales bacterium]